VLDGRDRGQPVHAQSWPGQMRTVWGDHERFFQTYFTTYRGKYFTGDGCRATRTAITGSPAASMT
jgi:acetyl-CoA synthetase